jgi:murein DD-endopeptidase MepM/ murein hydrolase activator NlpD
MAIDPTGGAAMASFALDPAARSGVDQPHNRPGSDAEAIRKFEGYLAQVMVREMRKTIPDGGLFDSNAVDMFMDVLDQEIADRVADGPGLGLQASLAGTLGMEPESPALSALPHEALRHRSWPARHPVDGIVTSRFGHRADPIHGAKRLHKGMDIAAEKGTPIRAVRDGVVRSAGTRGGYGKAVIVDHGDGLQTLYAHCDSIAVKPGTEVKAGQPIATVGDTGRTTGPHLHFEVRLEGAAVNPEGILRWR